MKFNSLIIFSFLAIIFSCSMTSNFEQYGSMHEAIGKQEHQGRVNLVRFNSSKNYIGLGAAEKLQGEITIFDGNIIATTVRKSNEAIPLVTQSEIQATMLVAERVKYWKKIKIEKNMNQKEFEIWLSKQANATRLRERKMFMFKVEGEFINLHTHIINGACPVHARMNGTHIPDGKKPYEITFTRRKGVLVGVYAPGSTGQLTHPGTNIHGHFVFKNKMSEYITAHVETSGVSKDSVVYLPQN